MSFLSQAVYIHVGALKLIQFYFQETYLIWTRCKGTEEQISPVIDIFSLLLLLLLLGSIRSERFTDAGYFETDMSM